jgi:two-component system, sporulation sensor kinase E
MIEHDKQREIQTESFHVSKQDWLSPAWQRSQQYGVARDKLKPLQTISSEDLNLRKRKRKLLLDVSKPFIDHLFKTVEGEFVVVIADEDAVLLMVRGDRLPLDLVDYHITEGVVWTEREFGANALGTALYLNRPIHMVGEDHYCQAFHGMTCAGIPIHDGTGVTIGALAIATYRKEHSPYLLGMVMSTAFAIEQAMRLQSENDFIHLLYERIVHTTNDLMLLVNEDGTLRLANQATNQLFGLSQDHDIRNLFADHSALSISLRTKQQLTDVLEEMVIHDQTYYISWDTYWIEYPMVRDSLLLLVGRDMTKVVQMQRSVKQLERLSTMGKFAAQMAHEIRNPIATIQLAVQLLQKQGVFQGGTEKKADLILSELRRIGSLTDHFLMISKPPKPQLRTYSVQNLLADTCELMNGRFIQSRIKLEQKYDQELPLQWIDPDQIQQVFINLLTNAIDATPEGGHIEVTLSYHDPDCYEIVVKDTGHGIPKENLQDIFEAFYTTKSKGIGLGLSNSKAIIEAHGGHMTVESVDGQGTAVQIQLPILTSPF